MPQQLKYLRLNIKSKMLLQNLQQITFYDQILSIYELERDGHSAAHHSDFTDGYGVLGDQVGATDDAGWILFDMDELEVFML